MLLAPVLQAAGEDGAAVAAAVARVVAAMSERDVEWATAATPLAEALARLMLACAGRPEHLLAELATDYFLQVGTRQGPGLELVLRHTCTCCCMAMVAAGLVCGG